LVKLFILQHFGSSANIQQWASIFTAGVSWFSRPDHQSKKLVKLLVNNFLVNFCHH